MTMTRRRVLGGAAALSAAGWLGSLTGGFVLRPGWAHAAGPIKMGIATDITGPIAPSGNANWQVAQFVVEEINKAGGIQGQPIELHLEDTASDPKIAVGNVRKLIQERRVNVVLGGITSAMRQAIKDPIVNRGRTLYIYPQLYEGQECTRFLFNTGPTPAQQCDRLIPYLIKTQGKKRFAMPSANYVWPQLLNKYARKVIEANGGEVVFEEYYPLDQAEYSATISKIRDGRVDCVFSTIIAPGLQPFMKQLFESGFQKGGGVRQLRLLRREPAELPSGAGDGRAGLLPRLLPGGGGPFSKALQEAYAKRFPGSKYLFTAGSASTGMYRGIKFYEAAVKATGGKLGREEVAAAMDSAVLTEGPGGGAQMVPGKMHARMNMYIAVCRNEAGRTRYEVVDKADMVDPREC